MLLIFPVVLGASLFSGNPRYAKKPKSDEIITWLPPENAFEFTFDCLNNATNSCNRASSVLERAGKRIAETILFRVPIKVHVTYSPVDEKDGMVILGTSCPYWPSGNLS